MQPDEMFKVICTSEGARHVEVTPLPDGQMSVSARIGRETIGVEFPCGESPEHDPAMVAKMMARALLDSAYKQLESH